MFPISEIYQTHAIFTGAAPVGIKVDGSAEPQHRSGQRWGRHDQYDPKHEVHSKSVDIWSIFSYQHDILGAFKGLSYTQTS